MIQHIKRLLGIGKPDPLRGNTLIVNVEKLERRVALLEDGVLEEYTVEREGDQNIVGGIFKGRVKNIEPGLKAMFVDIGMEKNAFLHFWDAIPAALDAGLEEIQREGKKKQQKKITSKDIPDIYPVGSEIVIQVSKGAIGTKGPRVTTNISLAGRYLVLMPYTEQFGISRKIEDPKERQRLRKIAFPMFLADCLARVHLEHDVAGVVDSCEVLQQLGAGLDPSTGYQMFVLARARAVAEVNMGEPLPQSQCHRHRVVAGDRGV